MPEPPIIKKVPDTPHSLESWRQGDLQYDLSRDAELAAKGDEEAQTRLDTKRLLALRHMASASAKLT